jgi:phage tail sheath protein FI
MTTYKTPGVYVEEISTLPPSVAEVSTAIPAFIGCTANGPTPDDSGKVDPVVARISTLLEYHPECSDL